MFTADVYRRDAEGAEKTEIMLTPKDAKDVSKIIAKPWFPRPG
jgi:hypothetical protein